MEPDELLAQLRTLATVAHRRFPSQEACLHWANRIAPLLRSNRGFHEKFSFYAAMMNESELSPMAYITALNHMKSILQLAIGELETPTILPCSPTTIPLEMPEQMTLSWLIRHVPIRYYWWLVFGAFTLFMSGASFSQTNAYKTIANFINAISTSSTNGTTAN